MRKLLLITLPLLLIVGCSSSPEPINYETTLIEREGVFYTIDKNKPYSGKVFSLYDDGKIKNEGTLKDGKKDGLNTNWYENGQKSKEETYKGGKEDRSWTTWYKNGQKKFEGISKDGKRDGLWTDWNVNGKKLKEETYKDGELISKKEWNEDGSVIE